MLRAGVVIAVLLGGSAPRIETVPSTPVRGTLFRVVVRDVEGTEPPRGTVAGEALHFVREGAIWTALSAAPIDSTRSVTARIIVGRDTLARSIPLARGTYASEQLRVAPQFTTPPDSALQARVDDESRRSAAVSRAAHATPPLWRGAFLAPRPGRITSAFGRARVFNGAIASRHMGTDWAGAVGAPVKAANRGVVRIVDRFYYGGNVIYIDHGAGLVTAYLHLSESAVAVGDTVERGQVIGRVGATGRVTGPHLHLIARYGSISVDPVSLLRVTATRRDP